MTSSFLIWPLAARLVSRRQITAERFVDVMYARRGIPVADAAQHSVRRAAVADVASLIKRLELPLCGKEIVGEIPRLAAAAVSSAAVAAAQLIVVELDEPVIGQWPARGIEQRILPSRPAPDHRQMDMPQRPYAIEIEQGSKIASGRPCPVIHAGISADRPIEEVGMAVPYPLDLTALIPKCPASGLNLGDIGKRDSEYGFPPKAS